MKPKDAQPLYLVTYRERWWCGKELIDECVPIFLGSLRESLAWMRANRDFSDEECWFWAVFRMEPGRVDMLEDEDLRFYSRSVGQLRKNIPVPKRPRKTKRGE